MGTLGVPDYLTAACESVRVGHRVLALGVAEVRSSRTHRVFDTIWGVSMVRPGRYFLPQGLDSIPLAGNDLTGVTNCRSKVGSIPTRPCPQKKVKVNPLTMPISIV